MLKEGTFTIVKFRKLFICAVLGWIVSMLGGMADSIIAGLLLDADAVSAIGLISPILSIAYFMTCIIGLGSAIMFSRTQGAFDIEKSHKIAGMALIISGILSVSMMAALFFGQDAIMNFYGVDGRILEYSYQYLLPIVFVAGIYPFMWTFYDLILYDGDEKIILAVDLMTAITNALFSLLLASKIGVAGLGWGTFISCCFAFVIQLLHFGKKTNAIHFKWYFSWSDLGLILKAGSALSLITLYAGIVDIVFNKIVINTFGSEYLPAYAVINVAMNFALALACPIQAGNVFVTVTYGEGNTPALKRALNITNKYNILFSIAFTAVMELLAPYWPVIYGIENQAVFDVAVYAGRIIPMFFIVAGIVVTYAYYLPAVDKTFEGNLLTLGYMLVGPLVIAIPLAITGGFNAMSFGFAATPLFALAITLLSFAVKKQLKTLPYAIGPTDEKEVHFDFRLDADSVIEGRNKIEEFLKEQGVDARMIIRILVTFEDAMGVIIKKNKNKKVICECSVLINDEHIRLITRDNGLVFDLLKEADDSLSFEGYVLARVISDSKENLNSVTASFNRNICIWER